MPNSENESNELERRISKLKSRKNSSPEPYRESTKTPAGRAQNAENLDKIKEIIKPKSPMSNLE
jgi:hypothetical protein